MAKSKSVVVLPEVLEFKIYTYYDKPRKNEGLTFDSNNSLTDQDFKMMTDVNYLLEHMAGHSRTPIYGIQDNQTFEDWSNEMAMLKRRFMNLSPELQKQFGNPQEFLKWCSNPENYKDNLPTIVQGLKTEEQLAKEKLIREEKATLLATKIAEVLKKE